jgi:hypothetical protein
MSPWKMLLLVSAALGTDVTQGIGVNCHNTAPVAGELAMIKAAGINWIRMDWTWQLLEPTTRGTYDFTVIDKYMADLGAADIKLIAILGSSNPLYDAGVNVHTDAGQSAYGAFAAACAVRYPKASEKGTLLLEMDNEPNTNGYQNATSYAQLVRHVRTAVDAATAKASVARARLAGPASANVGAAWMREIFEQGALRAIDHVTVHPYRSDGPETAVADLEDVRALVAEYAPAENAPPPLSCGEWGYASTPNGGTQIDGPLAHSKVVSRLYLTTIAARSEISIYYDWRDSGAAYDEIMGMVENAPAAPTARWPWTPKAAYNATRALTSALKGCDFDGRVPVFQNGRTTSDDWLLRFQQKAADAAAGTSRTVLVAWTSGSFGHVVRVPGGSGCWAVADWLGRAQPQICGGVEHGDPRGVHLNVTDAPLFLTQAAA